jgi:1-acyl-sn-glycerol-3-phosphate acyltransferase
MARERSGIWITLAVGLLYPAAQLLAKRVADGLENLPESGGALLVMNHVSHLDGPLDGVFVHKHKDVPSFMAKASLWNVPVLRVVLRGTGQVPVHRGTAGAADSMRDAVAVLEAGGTVVIYPEGTITKDPDGWPMSGRTGVARIALATGVPVIPIARWGTREILDHYNKKFRPFPRKTVTTLVGEPLDLSAYRGQPVTPQSLREVTDLIMSRVRDLLAEIRQQPAPEEFYRV